MKAQLWRLSHTLIPMVAAALLSGPNAQATAISVNGTCELGTCASPDSITSSTPIPTTPFSFAFTAGSGDTFNIAGTYAASYGAGGSSFVVTVGATYTGGTPSHADTLTIDMFQNIFDNGPGTFSGTYAENVPLTLAAGTSATANLFVGVGTPTMGVGLVGPFTGPGNFDGKASANLTLPAGNTLAEEFQFTESFAAGLVAGTTVSVTAAPEPPETIIAALACALFVCAKIFKKRSEIQPVC
jgi:hypothetical protein